MLEGLEISEIKLSTVLNGVETLRLDSEYYKKDFIKIEKYIALHKRKFTSFAELGVQIDCSAFYPALEPHYNTGTFPFIRVGDVKDSVDYANCIKIPETILPTYPTLKLVTSGDIVITKGGSIGRVGYVTRKSCVSRDLLFVRCSKLEEEQRIFLCLYLSTDFAYKQLIRSSSQCAQPHLTITLVKYLDLLKSSPLFAKKVAFIYNNTLKQTKQADTMYIQAERLFLSALGLENWQPKNETASVRKFSAVNNNNRYDAEYYQPKYDEIENKLLNDRSICNMPYSLKEQNYLPKNDKVYKYIELANIGANGEITGCTEALGSELPTRARRQVHCGDLIISSIEGSLQSCAYITEEYDNALCSTGFYVLSPKEINAETLLILFKSKTYQALLKKGCSGTILTAIAKNELEKIKLPIIPTETQNSIAEKVRQSFALRDESKRLLETAKRAVEIAIEEGEEKAVKYLEENK